MLRACEITEIVRDFPKTATSQAMLEPSLFSSGVDYSVREMRDMCERSRAESARDRAESARPRRERTWRLPCPHPPRPPCLPQACVPADDVLSGGAFDLLPGGTLPDASLADASLPDASLPDVGGAGDAVGSGFDSGFGADGLDSAGLEMGGGTWAAEMTSAWKQR